MPWISVDPLDVDHDLYAEYENAHPVEVTVNKGDMLYLPSLWYHHVRHTHACIAGEFIWPCYTVTGQQKTTGQNTPSGWGDW